jgi:hypothetical protein
MARPAGAVAVDRARRGGGDRLHFYIAAVMLVVLAFILASGHNLNNLMTQC